MQNVFVGLVCHYTNLGDAAGEYPPEQQAAIITRVLDRKPEPARYPNVALAILYPTGLFFMEEVAWSEKPERRHWSFIPEKHPDDPFGHE